MDDRNSWRKNNIPRNEEPTRFLTKEEMEELEQGIFEQREDEQSEKKTTNIKIEDLPQKENKNELKSPKPAKTKIKKYIKRLCLAAVFIAAGLAGFYLTFTWNMYSQSEDNAKEFNMKQMEIRQQKLNEQQKDLEAQIAQLEQEKEELSKQYGEMSQKKSFLVEMIDKITGKDIENKDAAEGLQDKIAELEQTLEDMNLRMDNLKDVKNQVGELKTTAQEELDKHRDIIDTVRFQIKEVMNDFLSR